MQAAKVKKIITIINGGDEDDADDDHGRTRGIDGRWCAVQLYSEGGRRATRWPCVARKL